ncbi:uncharacterized protein B0H18DRAFT_285112 [Fomitopsis serialis]|uniref:uncharacterized protein n=1 Tax=Fomitopsis serialis TaxID=139415 RepID=UPI002008AFAB|nr:uncharacterized protein B0H18DRAFT_285112 [Neoantrodia serialis]KAH9927693.1 hypothetical protein B0H18DRAFT_285112 [Neoantrodia serialis]
MSPLRHVDAVKLRKQSSAPGRGLLTYRGAVSHGSSRVTTQHHAPKTFHSQGNIGDKLCLRTVLHTRSDAFDQTNITDSTLDVESIDTGYMYTAFAVVIFYDHILYLDQEYSLFWRKKFIASSVIFIVNRYFS